MMMKRRPRPEHAQRTDGTRFPALVLVAALLLAGSTVQAGKWGAAIRIGVMSNERTLLAGAIKSKPTGKKYQYITEDCFNTDNDKDDDAIFCRGGDRTLVATATTTHKTPSVRRAATTGASTATSIDTTTTNGFRSRYTLPNNDHEEDGSFYDYEELSIPCAAVAVKSPFPGKASRISSAARELPAHVTKTTGGSTLAATSAMVASRPLVFWETMIAGAISRSVAQTVMHPANTMKTILQRGNAPPFWSLLRPDQFPTLLRGAGANFVLSVPHGAINFAVLEVVRKELARGVKKSTFLSEREDKIGPALDFMSSAISTICCSVVSTPQMMITDNIMAGNYPNLGAAIKGLAAEGSGLSGFYAKGWWPGLVGKIPSYALTWTFFQQLKDAQKKLTGRDATNKENTIMGCVASGATVCLMIPMDTIKTRLVTQARMSAGGVVPYKGIIDCAVRVAREEGIATFYKGLPPRLISVVPMIGIQFGVYEFMKKSLQKRPVGPKAAALDIDEGEILFDPFPSERVLEEASMEVAASPEHPYPAPHFLKIRKKQRYKEHKWSIFGLKKTQ